SSTRAATAIRADSRSPRWPWSSPRRRSTRASSPSRSSSATATRCRPRALALAQRERARDTRSTAHARRDEAEAALAERRSLLEKARQAERITAERVAASDRYERFRQAAEVDLQVQSLANAHPSPSPLPVLRGA